MVRLGSSESPWHFLRPLSAEKPDDRDLIKLTRGTELRVIGQMVSSASTSILYAASGNGKTSLINAGLIPYFTQLGYVVLRTRPRPPWSLESPSRAFVDCVLREVHRPLFSPDDVERLRTAIAALSNTSLPEVEVIGSGLKQLEAKLVQFHSEWPALNSYTQYLSAYRETTIPVFLRQLRPMLEPQTRILAICDQFEELFVHYANSRRMHEFVEQLGQVFADSKLDVHLLFSMREDWVGSMIEFRNAIPSIFNNYFKLNPLRKSVAVDAILKPLEGIGQYIDSNVVARMLDELAPLHPGNRASTAADDPFIELPALQIVADKLWSTRGEQGAPFSMAHYESLCDSATDNRRRESVARVVLDRYLLDVLGVMDAGAFDATAMRELRLDILYLLTDERVHRRARRWSELLQELRRIRPAALELPPPTKGFVEAALAPLIEGRLVDVHEAADRELQYELAHDFAVRAVVTAWRQLDRQRTMDLATRSQERREKEARFEILAHRELFASRMLGLVPPLAFALLILMALGIGLWEEGVDTTWHWRAVWSATTVTTVLLALAVLNRHWPSAISAAFGLLAVLAGAYGLLAPRDGVPQSMGVPFVVLGDLDTDDRDSFAFRLITGDRLVATTENTSVDTELTLYRDAVAPIPVAYNDDANGLRSQLEYTAVESGIYVLEVTSIGAGGPYTLEASLPSEPAVRAIVRSEAEPNDFTGSYRLRRVFLSPVIFGAIVLAIVAALLAYLRGLAHPLRPEDRRGPAATVAAVMLAELVDGLGLVLTAGSTLFVLNELLPMVDDAVWLTAAGTSIVCASLALAWMAYRGGTLGHWVAGIRLHADVGSRRAAQVIFRQVLFIVWTLANTAFLLPWLLVTSVVASRTQPTRTVYDRLAGVHVSWDSRATTASQQPSATMEAA